MKAIHLTLDGEEAIFSWRDGKVYCEGYDLESERVLLALTGFGEGVGVLLVASNACCKSEVEFKSEIRRFLSGHKKRQTSRSKKWPEGQLLFEYFSYSPDSEIRWDGLERAHLSERHYDRLLKESDVGFQQWMARLLQLPEKYFYSLARLGNSEVNLSLALNENCPEDILKILALSEDEDVRLSVARNPKAPQGTLEIFSRDISEYIRKAVAFNPNCPIEILKRLAKDKFQDARQGVAENPNCPIDTLELLSRDQAYWVRYHVVRNPGCTDRILESFASDIYPDLREYAQKRLANIKELEV